MNILRLLKERRFATARFRSQAVANRPSLLRSHRIWPLVLPCLIIFFAVSAFAAERPNILFILADDLGYEMLGSYGGLKAETPHLDRLAGEGMRFTRAYGSPVCTPTRMSLYTGLYPTHHHYTGVLPVHKGTKEAVDFKTKFPTYAQLLRGAGYATSTTGKWQLATLEFHPNHIRDAGFDSWCVWQIWREGAKTTRYHNPCFNHDGKIRDDIADEFGPDVLADYVIDQMRSAVNKGVPFCIHHNMLLPHEPIVETPDGMKSLRGMVTYMDTLIGRIVSAVDELGIAGNTCIVFLGDNGTDVSSIRKTHAGTVTGGKRTLGDGGTHLPLIARWPGFIAANTTAEDLVDVTDLFPTFCELAGVEIPEEIKVDGVSIAGRLLRSEPSTRKVTVAGFQNKFSVFDGEWRLNSDGTSIDARNLPEEKVATAPDSVIERLRSYLPKK